MHRQRRLAAPPEGESVVPAWEGLPAQAPPARLRRADLQRRGDQPAGLDKAVGLHAVGARPSARKLMAWNFFVYIIIVLILHMP